MEWQPIETAPKDGTRILLYQPEQGGQYGPNPEKDPDYYMFTGWWDERDGMWVCAEYDAFAKSPTHWMPEPPPPANAAVSGCRSDEGSD